MQAWEVARPGPVDGGPLRLGERPRPEPGAGEVRVRVSVCGVCRTDLHLAEGDLAPKRPGVTPGHEIVGAVDALGAGAGRFRIGQRVGVAWLRGTCGQCRFCRRARENLCLRPAFTGWDADGGYAEYAVVDERYAYALPPAFADEEAAPLLCAGIIGYRALKRTELPPGGRLGIYGFGASAHLAAQVALAQGATVHVLTRSAAARRLAMELGAASAGGAFDPPPEPLDARPRSGDRRRRTPRRLTRRRSARLRGALIDLHTHTDRSDGSDPPERIPELAAAAGCTAVAITDHDRLDGIARARARGDEVGVRVIGGCELSVGSDAGPLHLLAYFVEDADGPLRRALAGVQDGRAARNRRLARRLAELGLPATIEEIEAEAGGVGVGRPHVAAVLVRKGVVASVQEAFDVWLGAGRPAYVERRRLPLPEATAAIHASGGVAVVAHPLMLDLDAGDLDEAVAAMAAHGVDGLEAVYGRYAPEERSMLADLAARHGLVATGGSDYHGRYKPDLHVGTGRGDLAVPDDVLDRLEARRP